MKKILSVLFAGLFALSLFSISAFAQTNYNRSDLDIVRSIVTKSSYLSEKYKTQNESDLILAGDYIGEWNDVGDEKRLVAIDTTKNLIVDISGSLDLSNSSELSKINLSDNNKITEITFPKTERLSFVDISRTSVKSVDVAGLTGLNTLIADSIDLRELNLKNNSSLKSVNLRSLSKFISPDGIVLDVASISYAKCVGFSYISEKKRVAVSYEHPVGEVFLNKELLPTSMSAVSEELMRENGEPFTKSTVWFTLEKATAFEPVFVSNSINISKLIINGEEIVPNGGGVYVKEVATDTTEINIEVVTESPNARVEGAGKISLVEGENVLTVSVISADGKDSKDYTVKIVRTPTFVKKSSNIGTEIAIIVAVLIVVVAVAVIIIRKKNKK